MAASRIVDQILDELTSETVDRMIIDLVQNGAKSKYRREQVVKALELSERLLKR